MKTTIVVKEATKRAWYRFYIGAQFLVTDDYEEYNSPVDNKPIFPRVEYWKVLAPKYLSWMGGQDCYIKKSHSEQALPEELFDI